MAMYKYECTECGEITRKIFRNSDDDRSTIECPECGNEARKLMSSQSVHYKGSGFYNTDYKGGEDE